MIMWPRAIRVDVSRRQSKLSPSNPLTPDIYWTSDIADSRSLGHALEGSGFPSSLEPRLGVVCSQLSGCCSDVWDDYSVVVDRYFSP